MNKLLLLFVIVFNLSHLWANGETVVCLHGYFRSYKCMIPMSSALSSEGFDIYLWDYQSRKKTIEQHAEDLVVILNKIAAEKPGQPIHFVTHSLGGVITRVAVSHPDCPAEARIGKAILLAPPNQGSCLARKFQKVYPVRFVFGKRAGAQLLDHSSDEMLDIGQFPPSKEVMVVAGTQGKPWIKDPNDGKVSVNETYLNTPHIHITHHVSHSWIMTSRWMINMIREYLLYDIVPEKG